MSMASSRRVSPAKPRRSNWPQSPTGRDPVPRERPAKGCQGNLEDRAPARSPARQRSSGARASAGNSPSREKNSGARNGAGRLSESSQSSHKEKRHSTTSRRKSGQSATQSSVSTSACTSCTTSVPTSAAVSRASSPPISTAVSRVPSTPASAAASRAPSPPRSPVMSWTALSSQQPAAPSRPAVRVNPPAESPAASSASADTPTSTVINWFNLPEHDIEGTEEDSESPMQESLPADSEIVPLCTSRDSPAERLDKALMLESLWPPHSSRSSTAESPCVSLPSMSIFVPGEGNVHRMTSDGQRVSPSPPSTASGASVQSFVYAGRDSMDDLSEASEFEEVAMDDISDVMTFAVEKPSQQLDKDLARMVECGSHVASPSRSPSRPHGSEPKASIFNVATEVPTARAPGEETTHSVQDISDAPGGSGQRIDRLSPPASPTIHCHPWGSFSRVRIVSIGTEVTTARSPGPPSMVEGIRAPRAAANFCGTAGPPRENKEVGGVHRDASARSGSVRKVTLSPSVSPLRVGLGSMRVHTKVVLDGGVRCSPTCSPAGSRAGSPTPVRLSSHEATVYCRSHVGSPAGSRAGSPVPAAVQVSACKADAPQVQEQLQHTVRRVSRSSAPRPPVLPAGPLGPARSPRWAFNQTEDNRGMLGHPAPLCLAASSSSPSSITSVAKQQVVAISGRTTARAAVGIAKAASLQVPMCPSVGVPQAPPPQAPPIIHAPNPNEPQ